MIWIGFRKFFNHARTLQFHKLWNLSVNGPINFNFFKSDCEFYFSNLRKGSYS
jgi:hypothetical protein